MRTPWIDFLSLAMMPPVGSAAAASFAAANAKPKLRAMLFKPSLFIIRLLFRQPHFDRREALRARDLGVRAAFLGDDDRAAAAFALAGAGAQRGRTQHDIEQLAALARGALGNLEPRRAGEDRELVGLVRQELHQGRVGQLLPRLVLHLDRR